MSTDIDPYSEWLGLPPGPRPPDLYELLGLEPFCEDVSRIVDASRRQMSCIKPYEDHPDPGLRDKVHEVMNLIGRARAILRDPVKKSRYDRELSEESKGAPISGGPAPAAPIPPPASPAAPSPVESPPVATSPPPPAASEPSEIRLVASNLPAAKPKPKPKPSPARDSAEPPPIKLEPTPGPKAGSGKLAIKLTIVEELSGVVDTVTLASGIERIIGRDEDCAVCIEHASVSPRHARLTYRQGRWHITREDRQAEIMVNGRSCTQSVLADGDVMGIGVYELQVEIGPSR